MLMTPVTRGRARQLPEAAVAAAAVIHSVPPSRSPSPRTSPETQPVFNQQDWDGDDSSSLSSLSSDDWSPRSSQSLSPSGCPGSDERQPHPHRSFSTLRIPLGLDSTVINLDVGEAPPARGGLLVQVIYLCVHNNWVPQGPLTLHLSHNGRQNTVTHSRHPASEAVYPNYSVVIDPVTLYPCRRLQLPRRPLLLSGVVVMVLAVTLIGVLLSQTQTGASRPVSPPSACNATIYAALPLHRELITIAELETELVSSLHSHPPSSPHHDYDPISALYNLFVLVDHFENSLKGIRASRQGGDGEGFSWHPGELKKHLHTARIMLSVAGSGLTAQGTMRHLRWWLGALAHSLEFVAAKDADVVRPVGPGAQWMGRDRNDMLVTRSPLLVALKHAPPLWVGSQDRKGYLDELLGNLSAAVNGAETMIALARCDDVYEQEEQEAPGNNWSWWVRSVGANPCKTLSKCSGVDGRVLLCRQVERHIVPRVSSLRNFLSSVHRAIELGEEEMALLSELRITAAELLVGPDAARHDPNIFGNVAAKIFAQPDVTEESDRSYETAAAAPLQTLPPAENDAWYGEYELLYNNEEAVIVNRDGERVDNTAAEEKKRGRRRGWWRRRDTIGCGRTRYHLPMASEMATDIRQAVDGFNAVHYKLKARFVEEEERWKHRMKAWEEWRMIWFERPASEDSSR